MSTVASTGPPPQRVHAGRMFLNLPFDYLAIGGGLSLLTVAALGATGQLAPSAAAVAWIPPLVLASNSAHFAASTVRLYTKPGAFKTWPFLTMGLPLATLGVLALAIVWPGAIGTNLQALYLTWSPFHYAAQAFGLASMYHYRSGGTLGETDRRLLFAICMLPFLFAFLDARDSGLAWFVPARVQAAYPLLQQSIRATSQLLAGLVFLTPLALLARLYWRAERGLPLISWLILATNGLWWVVFRFYDAFVWATIFHGLQYLAIVMIFHAKDQMAQPGNRRGPLAHALRFYAASFALGYLLFNAWPFAWLVAGFSLSESMLLCAAVINLHHFIVDRYIWRLRRDDANRQVVER